MSLRPFFAHASLKRNAPVAALYEDAVKYEGAVIADSGALINYSGKKTGRSPKDKRIVYEDTSKDDIWVSCSAVLCFLHTA
jgi:phosphoenolpyruvate carboxykinase (ATP)